MQAPIGASRATSIELFVEKFVQIAGKQACEATLRVCRLRSSTGFVYFKNKTVNYNMQTPIGASRATSIELSVK